MESDSCASCRAQRRIIFFPQLPTETSCLNKNDTAGEQTCSPKGEGCVVLEGSITFLCSGVLSCLPCAAWARSAPGFVPPPEFAPTRKAGCPCWTWITVGTCSSPVLQVLPQGSSVGKGGIKDVKTQNNVPVALVLFCWCWWFGFCLEFCRTLRSSLGIHWFIFALKY